MITVAGSVIWTSFFDKHQASSPAAAMNRVIETIEKPAFNHTAQVSAPASTAQPVTAPVSTNNSPLPLKSRKQVTIGKGKVYVQVGAFKQMQLAQKLLGKMKRKYKRAEITKKSELYLVWVGPVMNKAEAEELSLNIKKHDHISGFIAYKQ